MSARIRYPGDKSKSSASNNTLKFILIVSLISVIVVVVGLKKFFSPYVADSENIGEEVRRGSNTDTVLSEEDMQNEVEFTFFDTLTEPEKYSSLDEQEENVLEASLNKKKESSLKPEPSQLVEKKEPKTQQPPVVPVYFVQMGSFKKKSRAESFVTTLNKKGYQVSIKVVEIPNRGVWYRIFMKEGFPDRESALKLMGKIKLKDNISALLKSSINRK